jgi:hypothetical protein
VSVPIALAFLARSIWNSSPWPSMRTTPAILSIRSFAATNG